MIDNPDTVHEAITPHPNAKQEAIGVMVGIASESYLRGGRLCQSESCQPLQIASSSATRPRYTSFGHETALS